jgi:hypothetical protein
MAKKNQIGTVGFEILKSKNGIKHNVVITHRPPNKEVERVEKYTDYASYSSVYRGAKRAAKSLGYKFVGNICNKD